MADTLQHDTHKLIVALLPQLAVAPLSAEGVRTISLRDAGCTVEINQPARGEVVIHVHSPVIAGVEFDRTGTHVFFSVTELGEVEIVEVLPTYPEAKADPADLSKFWSDQLRSMVERYAEAA